MGPGGDDGIADPGMEPTSPPEQLSGVAVVIIIAVGVQTFIMLFIFEVHHQVQAGTSCLRWTRRGESLKKGN
jgi:hypothetical protein